MTIARWRSWRGELMEVGLITVAIEKRVRNGRLHQLHAGVYLVGHQVVPREGRWMAAVLASGPEAVLSHWSAAALWMIRPQLALGDRRHHPAEEPFVEGNTSAPLALT